MKKIHYKNIGFPKTGTTWIYKQLLNHPDIDGHVDQNFKEYFPSKLELYKKKYEKYDISYNLHTSTFTCAYGEDNYAMPKNIGDIATHITMILRNPYDLLNSYVNYMKNINPNSKMDIYFSDIDNSSFQNFTNFQRIFDNWDQSSIPVKYMFYDDLVKDQVSFFYEICDYLGIRRIMNTTMPPVLVTNKKLTLLFDNKDMINYINRNISLIEKKFNKDLSHWKRDT